MDTLLIQPSWEGAQKYYGQLARDAQFYYTMDAKIGGKKRTEAQQAVLFLHLITNDKMYVVTQAARIDLLRARIASWCVWVKLGWLVWECVKVVWQKTTMLIRFLHGMGAKGRERIRV